MLFVVELLLKYATYFISREWSVVLCVASKSNTFFLIDDTEIGKSSSRHLQHHSWQPNNRIGILYTLWLTFNNWLNYDRAWYVFIRGYVVPRFDSGVIIVSFVVAFAECIKVGQEEKIHIAWCSQDTSCWELVLRRQLGASAQHLKYHVPLLQVWSPKQHFPPICLFQYNFFFIGTIGPTKKIIWSIDPTCHVWSKVLSSSREKKEFWKRHLSSFQFGRSFKFSPCCFWRMRAATKISSNEKRGKQSPPFKGDTSQQFQR